MAVADGDTRNLVWYVNNVRVGQSKVSQSLIWKAIEGKHQIRVVDDQGRYAESMFRVQRVD